MQYKHFLIEPFERVLGKWRAAIKRADGNAVMCGGTKMDFFTTSADTTTPEETVQLARNAIDGRFVS